MSATKRGVESDRRTEDAALARVSPNSTKAIELMRSGHIGRLNKEEKAAIDLLGSWGKGLERQSLCGPSATSNALSH